MQASSAHRRSLWDRRRVHSPLRLLVALAAFAALAGCRLLMGYPSWSRDRRATSNLVVIYGVGLLGVVLAVLAIAL